MDNKSPSTVASTIPDSPGAEFRSPAASPHWKPLAQKDEPSGFSPFVAFCFAINYILGTGFLTIPWAFVQGGLISSTLILILVCLLSDFVKTYLLETMARAEVMLDNQMRWRVNKSKGEEHSEKDRLLYSPVLARTMSMERGAGEGDEEEGGQEEKMQLVPINEKGGSKAMHHSNSMNTMYSSIQNPMVPGKVIAPGGGVIAGAGGSRPGTASHTPNTSLPGTPGTPGDARRLAQKRTLIVVKKKTSSSQSSSTKYLVGERKFEINALCRVFLGKRFGLHLYTFFLSIYVYCTLWAYTSVFASAMSKALPVFDNGDPDGNYLWYAVIFAVLVVPLSCMELNEQVAMQVFLTGCRFLMVFLMVFTSAECAQSNDAAAGIGEGEDSHDDYAAPLFNLSGLHHSIPILVFATIYHHSIPGLAHPVADKRELNGIFRATTIFSSIAYGFIGITLGYVFGTRIADSANLNWKDFGIIEREGRSDAMLWFADSVSFFVLCFPAIDVVSAFPLNAITLGNNLMGMAFGRKIHEVEKNRLVVIQFRLLASIPPILLGILVRELGTITGYAGTTAFIMTFTFPSLLYIRSRRKAIAKKFDSITYYTTFASNEIYAIALCWFGIGMFVFVTTLLIRG